MTQQTFDMLADMRLSAMATELANQLKDPSFAALGFEERLDMIVTAEWNKRQTNKINRLIKSAHFSASSATIEGIEYYEDRKLDKTQILRLATCKYIDEGHHVILKGASGNGKTYIACALGNAACRRLKKVACIMENAKSVGNKFSAAMESHILKLVQAAARRQNPGNENRALVSHSQSTPVYLPSNLRSTLSSRESTVLIVLRRCGMYLWMQWET